jgi:hypothetical protein
VRTLLSLALLAVCCLSHPARVHAPEGWYVNGVALSGLFELRPVLGRPEDDLEDARRRREIHDDRAITGRIYCLGSTVPINTDGRTVGCQPRYMR